MPRPLSALVVIGLLLPASVAFADESAAIGASGAIGCRNAPKTVARLEITKPGVYENYLIDAKWATGNTVKIQADDVTIRNCEIHSSSGNAIGVFGTRIRIENCRIHHILAGTYRDQRDAHGITGRWGDVAIRNCDISYISGDCIQFDPDRESTGKVTVEQCSLWTGPLPADAAGFKQGERPGENGIDTKTKASGPACILVVKGCYIYGWNQPAQIQVMAALNLKENVHAHIENCVLRDNENAFRLRGPGKRGGAQVEIVNCAIYDSTVGVRMEDKVRDLKIEHLGFGRNVSRKYRSAGGGAGPGYSNTGEFQAPACDEVLKHGF